MEQRQKTKSIMIAVVDLCKGTGCPIKKKCARYRRARGFYFYPQYINGECLLFIPKNIR